MIGIKKAENDEDIKRIADLASVIWHEHFTPIIGKSQVEYMLEKFQSFGAIKNSVENDGYEYYMAIDDGSLAGYIGIHPEEDNVFLSKIYVDKSHRRKGIAGMLLEKVKSEYPDVDYLWLTVNRGNAIAVSTYKAWGFEIDREQVTDIGNGFVMDDYVFKLNMK